MLSYMSGFANNFQTEACKGALPVGRNSPQRPPLGLYPEQLSVSSFTTARAKNLHSWLYRIRPAASRGESMPCSYPMWQSTPFESHANQSNPNQQRWNPFALPKESSNFIQSMETILGHGSAMSRTGACIHLYGCQQSMQKEFVCNYDGELLLVPWQGALELNTEMGRIEIEPGEIAVVPRGVTFQANPMSDHARGYVLENFGEPLWLPELGPIGANGLANSRDFLYPQAHYWDEAGVFNLITKFNGGFWQYQMDYHPLDVVAWHGNCAPYKYDLRRFNTIASVSYDHPDPSIFTVLTSQTTSPGVANVDFVIFPERWMVAEDTFRPPYYHRNLMSEYMGSITGVYDAKPNGFVPGGGSLHNCMAPHGPDADAFAAATEKKLEPEKFRDCLAFMFESVAPWEMTSNAWSAEARQTNYIDCWQGLQKNFNV